MQTGKRTTYSFERKSLFWKIYAAVLFSLFVPMAIFAAHRYYDEWRRARAESADMIGHLHTWSSTLSEQADALPDDALPAWVDQMERENGVRFYVVRNDITFRAEGSDMYHTRPSSMSPFVEDVSESGRTRVVMALRPPRRPPPGVPLARNAGILIVAGGGVLLSFRIVRNFMIPIEELRRATTQLANGDLSVRADRDVTGKSVEIGDLAASFNWMAERVEDLVTSQKRLLVDISHEIRSPLQRLDLALTLAQHEAGGRGELYFDRAQSEIARINEMVEELLTVTRTESSPAEDCAVDIEEILDAVADDAEFMGQLQRKTVEVDAEPLSVRGDPVLLKRAVGNVVFNAIRYTPEGTCVHITARRDGDFALVEIADAGPGVRDEELEKIFLPYYRTDVSRGHQTGTGTGLSITKRLVENCGGAVFATNVQLGGLCISIRLPLSPGS